MRYTPIALLASVLLSVSHALAGERTVTLIVDNMTCPACPYIVERSLAALPGVTKVEVSFENKTANVTFDDSETNVAALTSATANAGYPSQSADQPDPQ
jgi:periplasmic mercuric ion binding protein